MRVLRFYVMVMTGVWLAVLLAVVMPALTTGILGMGEAKTPAERLLAGAVWSLPATLGLAIALSWWCLGWRWERWAFYSSLLPVVNVLVAGVAWLWDVQTR